jgi:hypothetical protein
VRAALFSSLAVWAKWPILRHAALLNDFRDAHYFTLFEEAARLSVVKFHELPLWNPYYCGGEPGLGTPSAWFVSPTFVLTLLFGALTGDALITVVMTVIGLEGTFRYLRLRGAGSLASMMAAPVFAFSGLFAHAMYMGWTNFLGFELVPLALYGIHLALGGSRRGVVIAGLTIAWMIGFGGTYTAPLTALAALTEVTEAVVVRIREPRRIPQVFLMGLLVVVLSAGLALVRLWPIAETLTSAPRVLGGTPGDPPMKIWEYLFGKMDNGFRRADFFVGVPIVPLVILGSSHKRALPLLTAGIAWIWLSMGFKAPGSPTYSLFAALRHIPPFTMLRAPERFLVLVALVFAVSAALGIRRVEAAARRTPWLVLAAVLCLSCCVYDTILLIENDHAQAESRTMLPPPTSVPGAFHQSRGNRWLAAFYPALNRGTLSCFDDYDVPMSPDLRGDLEKEEYLQDPSLGSVRERSWSTSKIELDVDLHENARVLVNQNWHPGWRASVGQVVSANGLLAVDLPAGASEVTLRFLPRSAVGGLLGLTAGLLASAWLWRAAKRTEWISSGRDWLVSLALCASPFGAALLAFPLVHQPSAREPNYVTPDDEPMFVNAPPKDAAPVGAVWENGATLEAARIRTEPSDDGQSVLATLELDWRLERNLPSGLGVFVHLEASAKDHFMADHVLFSGTLKPEDAPLHKTIRDVKDPVVISLGNAPATWKVYVGLWRARLDQRRIRLVDGEQGGSNDDRVLVATYEAPAKPVASSPEGGE